MMGTYTSTVRVRSMVLRCIARSYLMYVHVPIFHPGSREDDRSCDLNDVRFTMYCRA